MRRPHFIARQARCPTGVFGELLARVMARETATENAKGLELLNLKPTDYVLEIGFGHGRTISNAARAACKGFVAGVDISDRMVRMAKRHNRASLAARRLELTCSDGGAIPYADCHFDKAYSIHTVYFWPRPQIVLKEIHRVLKKDGTLLLGYKSDLEKNRVELPADIYKFYSLHEMRYMLEGAGFGEVHPVDHDFSGRRILFLIARRSV